MTARVVAVLPTLGDRNDTLALAIGSVVGQMATGLVRLVVVVPPAAHDARALAADAGATVIDDPRNGLAGAMNAGVEAADGEEFYVGLGDDDLLRAGGISHLLEVADRTGSLVAFGACDYIDETGETIGTNRAGRLAVALLSWGPNLIPHPGTLIRLDAIRSAGGFALNRPYTMDLDMFLKIKGQGRIASTRRTVAAFRWHRESLTVAGRRASAAEALEVKKNMLPPRLRSFSSLWLSPIAWSTVKAGEVVSARSRRMDERRSVKKSGIGLGA